jgi:hypothetical protein
MNRLWRGIRAVMGWEDGGARPPKTGVDRASARHFIALVLVTLAIIAAGLIAAAVQWSDPAVVVGTPTPIATAATPTP